MARTKLNGVKLSEVSFVGKGDNKGAHIMLLKNHPNKIVSLGKEYKGREKKDLLQKWFDEDTSKADGIFKEEEAEMFADLLANKTIRDQVWSMVWMLEDSICSIMNDESATNKGELISTTVEQFKEAITSLTKSKGGNEDMAKTVEEVEKELLTANARISELEKQVGDLTTNNGTLTKERDELKKSHAPEGIDKSKLAPEVRKQLEDLETINKANTAAIEKMQDETLTAECISKALETPSISAEGVTVSDMLKSIKKAAPEAFQSLCTLLKATEARIKEGNLFVEKGKRTDANGGATAYEQLVAKAAELRKSKPELSDAQAFDHVYKAEHELRKQYNEER